MTTKYPIPEITDEAITAIAGNDALKKHLAFSNTVAVKILDLIKQKNTKKTQGGTQINDLEYYEKFNNPKTVSYFGISENPEEKLTKSLSTESVEPAVESKRSYRP